MQLILWTKCIKLVYSMQYKNDNYPNEQFSENKPRSLGKGVAVFQLTPGLLHIEFNSKSSGCCAKDVQYMHSHLQSVDFLSPGPRSNDPR